MRKLFAIPVLLLIASTFEFPFADGSESLPASSGSGSGAAVANDSKRVTGPQRFDFLQQNPQLPVSANRPGYRIVRDQIDSPEWRDAIATARAHMSGRGHYSLMRVFLDDSLPTETIQAKGTKLKELTAQYSGGGGEFRKTASGGFIFLEHINSNRRRDGQDPVKLGSSLHGASTIWIPEPPSGQLGIVGDVILQRCPHEVMGELCLTIKWNGVPQPTMVTLGPVAVGGPYGTDHRINAGAEFKLKMPPGEYKALFPQFDLRTSRWNFTIVSGQQTRLTFEVVNGVIRKSADETNPVTADEKDQRR